MSKTTYWLNSPVSLYSATLSFCIWCWWRRAEAAKGIGSKTTTAFHSNKKSKWLIIMLSFWTKFLFGGPNVTQMYVFEHVIPNNFQIKNIFKPVWWLGIAPEFVFVCVCLCANTLACVCVCVCVRSACIFVCVHVRMCQAAQREIQRVRSLECKPSNLQMAVCY